MQLVASLEGSSEHPLAAAVVKGAEARNLSLIGVDGFNSITGKGVTGIVSGKLIAVGNDELFREPSIDATPLQKRAESLRIDGQTVMLVAIDGKAAGLVAVSDLIKDSTPEAIRELDSAGLKIIMVTGDNATTAKAVAQKLGIEFEADVLPDKKAEVVASHQKRGFTMTLPSGYAFTTLTGATSVTIYQQPKTMMANGSSIASGSTVHAFGLLFFDGGKWKMVASRLGSN